MSLAYFCIMNLFQRTFVGFFIILFLSLTLGIEIYSVHCNMRGETFVSLTSGMDPCLMENEFEANALSCCASKNYCSLENEGSCCDEEQIQLSFEPDAFSSFKIGIPHWDFLQVQDFSFVFTSVRFKEEQLLAEFPQPPPLYVRERLSINCVWRI